MLCPVDFSALSRREVRLGVEVCRFFDARLLLFHNLTGLPPAGMGVGWMWSEEHQEAEARRKDEARAKLIALLDEIPSDVSREGKVSHGTFDTALPRMIAENDVDLVIMGTHGASTPEHRSATESFVAGSACPVLTIRDRGLDTDLFAAAESSRLHRVLVPLDFADYSLTAAAYAFELARRLPIELHLLHAEPSSLHLLRRESPEEQEHRLHTAEAHLRALVASDLVDRTTVRVTLGAAGDQILEQADRLDASLIVMGVHEKGFLRRWIGGAPSTDALFGSPCPVLFVSAAAAENLRSGAAGGLDARVI